MAFPIAQLGNCESIEACRQYCSDEANQEACISFAKEKGFYKETNKGEGNARSRAILEKAKSELGCASEQECKEICSLEENRDKCMAFAKKYSIKLKSQNPESLEVIEKAKEILGCSSPEACKAICEDEANREKCSEFAKSVGLKGGVRRAGPGRCKSESECKEFCSNPDNFEQCQKFGGGPEGQFHGPGGCTSKESCEEFCKENEDKCQGFKERFEDKQEMEKKCQENPEECLKKQNEIGPNPNQKAFENANERAKFCRENPEKCTKNLEGKPGPVGSSSGLFQKPNMINHFEGQRGLNPENKNQPQPYNQDMVSPTPGANDLEDDDSKVQGVSTSRSFVHEIIDFFLGRHEFRT